MSKLNELLTELCPNGVEYKPLWSITNWDKNFNSVEKYKQLNVNKYHYYFANELKSLESIGGNIKILNTNLTDLWVREEDVKDTLSEDEVICIPGGGNPIVQYYNGKFVTGDNRIATVKDNNQTSTKYLYYCLQNQLSLISTFYRGSGIKHPNMAKMLDLSVPHPPIEVQREIVRILDNFTELTEELTEELTAREKQYEYYRDFLLDTNKDGYVENVISKLVCKKMTHNVDDKNSENDSYINGELTGEIQCNLNKNTELNASANNSVEYIELEKIFDIRNGYTPSKKEPSFWNNGNIPWFRMEDIRGNGSILNDSKQHVTKEAVKKSGLFKKNSILLATTATIGVHAIITCEYLANQQFTNFSIRKEFENKIMPKFAYYYFFKIDSWCLNNVNISNFASVDVSRMKQLIIPIPPIDVQREIVRILDRFEHLCSDLKNGIPAEIEARKKQYEYYREKLLTFKKLEK